MKRGTPEHPKTLALIRALKIPKYAAVGILECIWHFASRYAPQGNIGKYSDQEIADAAGWTEDAGKLMESLFICRWLDKSRQWRYCIHDWADHLDGANSKWLKRNNLEPIVGEPAITSASAITNLKREAETSRNVAKCTDNVGKCPDALTLPFPSEKFKEAWDKWETARKEKRKPLTNSMRKGQWKKCAKWGEKRSIAAIDETIAQGWDGLYEAKGVKVVDDDFDAVLANCPSGVSDAEAERMLAEGEPNA